MQQPAALALALVLGFAAAYTAPAAADQKDKRLEPLFAELKSTSDPVVGERATEKIWGIWLEAGDAKAQELLESGIAEMNEEDYDAALADFDKLVAAAPNFAEGWNRRATLRYLTSDFAGSVADIERTLALEPRHFGALSGLGLIYMRIGKDEAALKAFKRALEIDPFLPGAKLNVETIEKRLKDHAI